MNLNSANSTSASLPNFEKSLWPSNSTGNVLFRVILLYWGSGVRSFRLQIYTQQPTGGMLLSHHGHFTGLSWQYDNEILLSTQNEFYTLNLTWEHKIKNKDLSWEYTATCGKPIENTLSLENSCGQFPPFFSLKAQGKVRSPYITQESLNL